MNWSESSSPGSIFCKLKPAYVTKYLDRGRRGIYFDLIDNSEGICVSRIGEDYLHQGVCNTISAICRSFKGIVEIGCRIVDRSMTTKDDKTCNADASIFRSDNIISWYRVATYKMRVKTLTMPIPLDNK